MPPTFNISQLIQCVEAASTRSNLIGCLRITYDPKIREESKNATESYINFCKDTYTEECQAHGVSAIDYQKLVDTCYGRYNDSMSRDNFKSLKNYVLKALRKNNPSEGLRFLSLFVNPLDEFIKGVALEECQELTYSASDSIEVQDWSVGEEEGFPNSDPNNGDPSNFFSLRDWSEWISDFEDRLQQARRGWFQFKGIDDTEETALRKRLEDLRSLVASRKIDEALKVRDELENRLQQDQETFSKSDKIKIGFTGVVGTAALVLGVIFAWPLIAGGGAGGAAVGGTATTGGTTAAGGGGTVVAIKSLAASALVYFGISRNNS